MHEACSHRGQAKAALVFGEGADARAVIAPIVAQSRARGSGERLRFIGPAAFVDQTAKHIADSVLPVVDHVCRGLGLRRRRFDISVANIGAAAAADIGFAVTGYSADVPVLAAMLAAALEIEVSQNVVSTGHVASLDGRIALVRGIPAKLAAAEADESTKTFVYPAFQKDVSLSALAPGEFERAAQAIFGVAGTVQRIAVSDVAELVQTLFPDESIVLGSFRHGYFDMSASPPSSSDPIGRATRYLRGNNEARFWSVLERRLLEGENKRVAQLLSARLRFEVRRKAYASGLGSRLARLVGSLPPVTRRLKIKFPLSNVRDCIRLGQFATEADHEDVRLLIGAVSGKGLSYLAEANTCATASVTEDDEVASGALEAVLDEISEEALARRIGLPIDSARASYHMDTVTVVSFDEFSATASAYYLHLLRHTRFVPSEIDAHAAAGQALSLVDAAFRKQGGHDAALAEARDGTRGGLRYVLDAMTERFKADQQASHVKWVLTQAFDPLDWSARVAFTAALLRRVAPHLPEEIRAMPAERLAKHYELIAQAYVRSTDRVRELLRTL